jgi:hypothetical protein
MEIGESFRHLIRTDDEVTKVKQQQDKLARTSAPLKLMLESIDKTQVICSQFNFAVHDLRNQIDTTDAYIENYLPFKTLKELTLLLDSCFDHKVTEKIKVFEANRIKELYAHMI